MNTDALQAADPWIEWAAMLDRPDEVKPCAKPEPRPPVSARPKSLRVTEIGTWRRNPYAIYAKHISRLRKIEPLEAEIGAADKGIVIHAALEKFIAQYPGAMPPYAYRKLIEIGREVFLPYRAYPQVAAFWWPRFECIAEWFIEKERERRAAGIKPLKAEAQG